MCIKIQFARKGFWKNIFIPELDAVAYCALALCV